MIKESEIKWHLIRSAWDGGPAKEGEVVRVGVGLRPAELVFRVDAPFHDDPPPDGPAGRTDRLWEYEVVEVFLLGAGGRYLELEVAPDRHLFLEFEGARRRIADDVPGVVCTTSVDRTQDPPRWSARLAVPLLRLPPAPLRWNAYACHGQGEARRLLALHPQTRAVPDFHDLDSYGVLELSLA